MPHFKNKSCISSCYTIYSNRKRNCLAGFPAASEKSWTTSRHAYVIVHVHNSLIAKLFVIIWWFMLRRKKNSLKVAGCIAHNMLCMILLYTAFFISWEKTRRVESDPLRLCRRWLFQPEVIKKVKWALQGIKEVWYSQIYYMNVRTIYDLQH